MSNTPAMPQPEKDLDKMELKDLQKEVATLRLFVASLKEHLTDYVDRERLPEALNHRIAEIETTVGGIQHVLAFLETQVREHRTLPHDQTALDRSIQSLSRRLDTLERKAENHDHD